MAANGIYQEKSGKWRVDKWHRNQRILGRFESYDEAEQYLVYKLEGLRKQHLFGERPTVLFGEAAGRFLDESKGRSGLETDIHALNAILPYIANECLERIDNEVLAKFIEDRRAGRARTLLIPGKRTRAPRPVKASTINASLELVRRICNMAANEWKHGDRGLTWLERAPVIKLLPKDDQRLPRPITWSEQTELLEHLPLHLRRMALFTLNTGVRDEVVCGLRWDWEVHVPELGFSIFVVPPEYVKGGRREGRPSKEGLIVCNSVVQALLDEVRGMHKEFVFVWRRERVKNFEEQPAMRYRPVKDGMLNTGWINACRKAGLDGLHVHDLRHTVGLRLREAGVPQHTISDILWHQRSGSTITAHYSQAQIVELREALELIHEDRGQFNKTIQTLVREAKAAKKPAKKSHRSPTKLPMESPSKGHTAASKATQAPSSSGRTAKPRKRPAVAPAEGKSRTSPTKVPRKRKRT